ncbi:MAG: NrfD/PsrC family molybdoenzyme membrane anchor subunit [Thermodesulfobacteriota bacterium]
MSEEFPIEALEESRLDTEQIRRAIILFALLAIFGLTAGIYAKLIGHRSAFNLSREIPWGIMVATFGFFTVTATGVGLLAAAGHLVRRTGLAPLGNRAIYLTVILLLAAFFAITLQVQHPWRLLVYNMTSPNLTSNIWWMSTLYGIMVGSMSLEFVSMVSVAGGGQGSVLKMSILGALAGLAANNNLAAMVTAATDPPVWQPGQLQLVLLVSALLSGSAALVAATVVAAAIRGSSLDRDSTAALSRLTRTFLCLVVLVLVLNGWRLYGLATADSDELRQGAQLFISGPLATNFWIFETALGLVAPLGLLLASRLTRTRLIGLAAALALVGAFFQRYDILIAGQIIPAFRGWDGVPPHLEYAPSSAELLVVLGSLGLLGTGFLLGERFFGRVFQGLPPLKPPR